MPVVVRILYLSSFLPYADSPKGGPTVMWHTATRLRARHDVTVVAFEDPDAARTGSSGIPFGDDATTHVVRRPLIGMPAPIRMAGYAAAWAVRREPLRALAFRSRAFQRTIDGAASRRDFDIVHVEDNAIGQYALPRDVPRLLIEHEVRVDGDARVEVRRWRRYQREVWRRFDRIQTFTASDAHRMVELAPEVADRICVNPFGVDPGVAGVAEEEAETLLFIGGFRHPPNVDGARWLVSEILPRVRRRTPAVHLVIAGADPPRAVRVLAGEGVTVTGWVPTLRTYLDRATIVIAPLRRGGGMRVKVLEGMAHGKAVVATSLAVEGVVDDDTSAPLLVADDADGFADAVHHLLVNPGERRRLGDAARDYVARHRSWDAYVARLERTYTELLAGRT